jgi:hypothetical protein
VAADWDRTGKLDLLVGAADGSVLIYRNAGSRTEPKLSAPQVLVPAGKAPRGGKAKICVVDWNGDGWPDLLVGDDSVAQPQQLNLTDEQKARQKQLQEKLAPLTQQAAKARAEAAKLGKAPRDEPADDRAARLKKLEAARDRLAQLEKDTSKLQEALSEFEPAKYHGYVWLFLRTPPTVARSR